MIGAEDRVLYAVIPRRHRAQRFLHRIDLADIAAGQHGQRAETDRAAQDAAAIDVLDELAVLGRARSDRCVACGRNSDGVRVRMAMICSFVRVYGVASVFAAIGVASATWPRRVVFNNWAAGEHGERGCAAPAKRASRGRAMNATIAVMQKKCTSRMF